MGKSKSLSFDNKEVEVKDIDNKEVKHKIDETKVIAELM